MQETQKLSDAERAREVRLRFSKTGVAKYISHLDINRAFSRAFSRAGINLWFTEGYNPRPYMSFSLPLSLGIESECENVDIRILDDISDVEIKDRMNAVMPEGIRIVDVYEDFFDANEIKYSDYIFKLEFKDNNTAFERIKAVFAEPEILALKKAKKGKKRILKETDIKQFIVSYDISLEGEFVVIKLRLLAGPQKNLNPTLLFDTIIRLIDMDFEYKEIHRTRLLRENFEEYR